MGADLAPQDAGVRPRPGPINDLRDAHGRVIRDVRLSLTDRCNFRCVYCMDPDHAYLGRETLLTTDELLRLSRILAGLGVRKLRLTGGEPTLHRDLDRIVEATSAMGFEDLAMTTNGSTMTVERARRWRALGLDRLTFSLDTLREDRIGRLTRAKTTVASTVAAVRMAREAGFERVKINAVVMRGINDDECGDFADFARDHEVDVRLIEWMPLDSGRTWRRDDVVSADEMLAAIKDRHDLVPIRKADPSQTSDDYGFGPDPSASAGRIGIIASVTRPFCGACSRLRITADGMIRPCLFSHDESDLKPVLRDGSARDEDVIRAMATATWRKQAGHGIDAETFRPPERGMSAIGG